IGWGSLEVLEEAEGRQKQKNFTDYTIPTTLDVPEMDTVLFDNPYEYGPFGAKGAGELTLIAGAPVFLSAVRHATGVDPLSIPLTPEYLEELIHAD
ncbi:MAG: aldehyde oxidase, partial [Spirochaetales bacterium]|nr:aldehyde oxidase [Spirochaetales bacterium]